MTILDPTPEQCLSAGRFVDSDHPDVVHFARGVCDAAGATNDRERSVALFLAVRDGIRYDPYSVSMDPDMYRASRIVHAESAYCIPKAILLTASCRVMGIPARLGFADVRNHLQSTKLREAMGTDVFAWHGYSELWLNDKWVKVSSAFNIELCERFGTLVLDFDGENDALMHPYDRDGNRHMEYVVQRGSYDDLPLDEIMASFADIYSAADAKIFADGHHDEAFAAGTAPTPSAATAADEPSTTTSEHGSISHTRSTGADR